VRIGILSEILNGIWMMERSRAEAYLPVIASLFEHPAQVAPGEQKDKIYGRINTQFASSIYQISEYGNEASPEDAPAGSIAVISMIDAVTKYDQECGPSGVKTKINLLARADANPNIKAAILFMDGPGGEAYAAMAMNKAVKDFSKPIFVFIDDLAASAHYFIAAASDGIFANRGVAKVGSIGTYSTIADYTEFFKQKGIKLTDVYAEKSIEKNKPYKDALEGDLTAMRADVNRVNEEFIQAVKDGRGSILSDEKEWGTGKLFFAEEAIKHGLIDGIGTFDEVLNYIVQTLNT
jgi:signal peptide peptidase SppA